MSYQQEIVGATFYWRALYMIAVYSCYKISKIH